MKKDFKGGLQSLLGEAETAPKKGRPKTQTKTIEKSSQEGTKANETRATFIVNEDTLERLKRIAYWDRLLIKEVVNQALERAVKDYEKKNGTIEPIPTK